MLASAMRFHLLRHGRTAANAGGLSFCAPDEVLDAVGERQAQRLAGYLANLAPDTIWTSPLPRAIATIAPFCAASGRRYEVDPLLAEGGFNLDPDAGVDEPTFGADGLPPADEPIAAFRGRVRRVIDRVAAADGPGTVLVMTHGQFIREFLNLLLGASRYVRWPVANCSDTLVEVGEHVFVRYVNRLAIDDGGAAGGGGGT